MDWRLKALIQFTFAHLPFGERLNHWAQTANGQFSDAAMRRSLRAQHRYLSALNERFPLAGKTVLEIGPGWAGIGVVLLSSFGVGRIYGVDHQPHLRLDLLRRTAKVARSLGIEVPEIRSLEDLRLIYLAPGDAARTGLKDKSVDVVYSYGVLEHIPRAALEVICKETVRILHPGGRACHNIGLHDHFHSAGLGNGVNFLRYPEWLWNFVCGNAILYHNRLRLPHYLEMFERHGLTPVWQERELLELNIKALRAIKVDHAFEGMSETDLATSHLFVDLVT